MTQRYRRLEELLQQCTVKLKFTEQSGYGYGTGFFVAPGLILTCGHLFKVTDERPVKVRWQNQEDFAEARVEKCLPDFDLALLRLGGGAIRDLRRNNIPARQGLCRRSRPTLNGTLSKSQSLPTSVILEKFPELLELQRRFQEEEPHWLGLLSSSVKLHGVPELPPHFLPRPNELQALKKKVLRDTNQPVAVTGRAVRIGIQGMGGIGKSVLAAALARDDEVRAAFPDGVFWLKIGQEPKITFLQSTLTKALSHISEVFVDEQDGRTRLSELLENKACLLILDDGWQTNCLEAFDVLGQHYNFTKKDKIK